MSSRNIHRTLNHILNLCKNSGLHPEERASHTATFLAKVSENLPNITEIKFAEEDRAASFQFGGATSYPEMPSDVGGNTGADTSSKLEELISSAFQSKLAPLVAQLAEKDKEISDLKAQLASRNQVDACEEAADTIEAYRVNDAEQVVEKNCDVEEASCTAFDQTVTPLAFSQRAQTLSGRQQWHTAFAHKARMTTRALRSDLQRDLVPDGLVTILASLQADDWGPASRQHWSDEERSRLSILLAEEFSDIDLAHHLSAEFGRRIFASGIARQRRRLQWTSGRRVTKSQSQAGGIKTDARCAKVDEGSVNWRAVDAITHAAL